MKKIFTLLVFMMAMASVQAKTDRLNASQVGLRNATYADGVLTFNKEYDCNMTIFSFSAGELANYKTLTLNISNGTTTSQAGNLFRLEFTGTSKVNAYTKTDIASAISINLSDLGITLGDVTAIKLLCPQYHTGTMTFALSDIYLETEEYDYLSLTTPIADMTWYSQSDDSEYSKNDLTKNLNDSLGQGMVIYGSTNGNATTVYTNVADYDKVNFTLSDAGDAGIRLMYQSSTITINTDASTTNYSTSLSTMPKIGTIKTKNVTVSDKITVSAIEFEKAFAGNSTTAFSVSNSISGTVAYDRQFTAGQKYTICLPFSLTKTEMDEMGAFYYFNYENSGKLEFKQASNSVSAYTPYIFVPSSNGTPFANLSNKAIAAPTATTVTKGDFTFTGLLAATTDIAADHSSNTVYGFSSTDGSFKKAGTGVSVNAFRAVIVGPAGESARSLGVNFIDDETTGIETINREPLTVNQMYNLAGQRVSAAHKGLVIKNGRKYLVK